MSDKPKRVCVRVSCKCPRGKDNPFYPENIIGFYRIDTDDPRAKIGEHWKEDGLYCQGKIFSSTCESADCNPHGQVIEVIEDCEKCPYKENNSWYCQYMKDVLGEEEISNKDYC